MPMFFVQYRRQISAAPTMGNWDVYSGAWFEASSLAAVQAKYATLEYLFLSCRNANAGGNNISDTRVFTQATGFSGIKIWEDVAGSKVLVSNVTRTVPTAYPNSASFLNLPSQVAICVGYRSTTGANVRYGRSRWFIGPLYLGVDHVDNAAKGNMRLNSAGVASVATAAQENLAALAGDGVVLHVRSGTYGAYTFAEATEVYVDDVLDVQRRRRTWQADQERFSL